ncbi:MAG: histidine--tRNA ligase [Acidimicrobiales bacterium]|nr:histidine--tRNA ligase [Acidimicrobiales bacterium]
MAQPLFQAPPGTRDLMPPVTDRMRAMVAIFADEATKAGFGQVTPPMFEDVGVFVRIGESTDVVNKELYTFEDKGGRTIALRPEQTASLCRVFVQRRPLTPWKAWYFGANFRYEQAQKGRYRQFDQVGAEVIGSSDPDIDTEIIALAWRFYERIGLTNVTLLLNSLGDAADRGRYTNALRTHFTEHRGSLTEQSRETLDRNPLRVMDSKRQPDQAIIDAAPLLGDFLSDDARTAFDRVQAGLTALAIPFEIAPRLVRGLDYYNRTTFEFVAPGLDAAQNAVGGGGRYDGLVANLGGPDEPGIGFALGIDRTLLACDAEDAMQGPDTTAQVWVVVTAEGIEGLEVADRLRRAGIRADRTESGRSMKAQMKAANKSGAAVAVVIGPDEVRDEQAGIKPLRGQGDQTTVDNQQIVQAVQEFL